MRVIASLFIASLSIGASAIAAEPTHVFDTIMKDHVASVETEENLSSHAFVYRAYLCRDGDCDMFESTPENTAPLADFAYLFAVYDLGDEFINAQKNPAPIAQTDATGDAILKRNSKLYGCGNSQTKTEQKCVMHALFKAGNLKRYYTKL